MHADTFTETNPTHARVLKPQAQVSRVPHTGSIQLNNHNTNHRHTLISITDGGTISKCRQNSNNLCFNNKQAGSKKILVNNHPDSTGAEGRNKKENGEMGAKGNGKTKEDKREIAENYKNMKSKERDNIWHF